MEKLYDMENQNVCQSDSSLLTLTLLARSILLISLFVYVCVCLCVFFSRFFFLLLPFFIFSLPSNL